MYCPRDSKIITRFFAQFCLDNHAQRITSPEPTTKPSHSQHTRHGVTASFSMCWKPPGAHKSMSFSSRELSLVELESTDWEHMLSSCIITLYRVGCEWVLGRHPWLGVHSILQPQERAKLTSSCADRYSLVVDVIYPFISCRLLLQLSCWRGWSSRGNQIAYWTARRVHKCLSKPWPVADMKRRREGSKSRLEEWTAQQRKAWPPF